MSYLIEILKELKQQNVTVQFENGGLKLKGAVKSLSPAQIEKVKSHKEDLIEFFLAKSGGNQLLIPRLNNPDSQPFPLTKNQEGIWFLHQLNPEETSYNVSFSVVLSGKLDTTVLELAINNAIAECSSLRTVFFEENGLPYQRVQEKLTISLVEYLSSGKSTDASKVEAELANTPFDLSEGPLIRAGICSVNSDTTLFSLCIHHLVIDGWSMGLLFQMIQNKYNELLGRGQKVQNPSIRYSDYVDWSSKRDDTDAAGSADFWKRHISQSEGKGVTFPYSLNIQNTDATKGERMYYSLPKELVESVEQYCRSIAITPFNFYFSIFNVLLYKFNDRNEFVVGVPYANRSHKDLYALVGFVTNVLAVNSKIFGSQTFKETLLSNAAFHKQVAKHQSYPLNLLQQSLQSDTEASSEMLFNTLFAFQNMKVAEEGNAFSDGVQMNSVQPLRKNSRAENVGSKFDISFQLGNDLDGVFQLEIEYKTDRYSRARIAELFHGYLALIETAIDNDGTRIGEVGIVSKEREKEIYSKINRPIPVVEDHSITQLLDRSFASTPANSVAVIDDDTTIEYGDFIKATDALAYHLQVQFDNATDGKIGILCERNAHATVALVAALKSGSSYVPIDIAYPKERIEYLIQDASLEYILVDDKGRSILEGLGVATKAISIREFSQGDKKPARLGDVRDQTAYLIYTSGSTGTPKGVEIAHRNVISLLNWAKEEYATTMFDTLYSPTSYCFDLSVFEYLFPLIQGKSIRVLTDVSKISDYLKSESNIFINTVPSVIKALMESRVDFSNVSAINMAGEVIPTWIKEELDIEAIEVRNLYGPSEDTTYSTCYRFSNDSHDSIPIGKPILGTHLFVVDRDNNIVPEGVEGEICLTGESVAKGYYNRPDLTEKAFVETALNANYRVYKTGDIGKILHDGQVAFVGRRDNQIKLRGFRIELGEIKSTLERLDGVQQAEVVLIKEHLVAVWTGEESDSDRLAESISQSLPIHFVPQHWHQIDKFPTNLNGKLDRKKLISWLTENFVAESDFVAPSSEVEKELASIWSFLLEKETVGIRDNFFGLGGHSLVAIQLRHAIAHRLNYEIEVEEIFSNPTIYELAQLLESKTKRVANFIPTLDMAEGANGSGVEVIKKEKYIPLDVVLIGADSKEMERSSLELNTSICEQLHQLSSQLETENKVLLATLLQKTFWTIAGVDVLRVQFIQNNSILKGLYHCTNTDDFEALIEETKVQISDFDEERQEGETTSHLGAFDDLAIISDVESASETFITVRTVPDSQWDRVTFEMRAGHIAQELLQLIESTLKSSIQEITEKLNSSVGSAEETRNNQPNINGESTSEKEVLNVDFNF